MENSGEGMDIFLKITQYKRSAKTISIPKSIEGNFSVGKVKCKITPDSLIIPKQTNEVKEDE